MIQPFTAHLRLLMKIHELRNASSKNPLVLVRRIHQLDGDKMRVPITHHLQCVLSEKPSTMV